MTASRILDDLTLTVAVGRPLAFGLQALPGAGYLWVCTQLPAGVALADGPVQPLGPGIGGPVSQGFVLRASQPGRHTLDFDFKRSWETEVRARQRVVLTVTA